MAPPSLLTQLREGKEGAWRKQCVCVCPFPHSLLFSEERTSYQEVPRQRTRMSPGEPGQLILSRENGDDINDLYGASAFLPLASCHSSGIGTKSDFRERGRKCKVAASNTRQGRSAVSTRGRGARGSEPGIRTKKSRPSRSVARTTLFWAARESLQSLRNTELRHQGNHAMTENMSNNRVEEKCPLSEEQPSSVLCAHPVSHSKTGTHVGGVPEFHI